MNNRELTHHGILGMKWGVQNGPPYPLAPGDHSASERRAGWRKSLSKSGSSARKMTGNRAGAEQNQQSRLSDRQKKILMGVAIGTAVGLGVGMAYWYGGRSMAKNLMNSDLVIPAGELLKRVSPASEKGLHDRFYAVIGKDANKYKVFYAEALKRAGEEHVIQKTISSKKDLKIAGNDTCAKIFEDLRQRGRLEVFDLTDDKVASSTQYKSAYDFFNVSVVDDQDDALQNDFRMFYNELKKSGYDGFIDRHDQSYSDYFTKAPMILFNDTSNSNFSIDVIDTVTDPKFLDVVKEWAKTILLTEAQGAYEKGEKWIVTEALLGGFTGLSVAVSKARKEDERKKENDGT